METAALHEIVKAIIDYGITAVIAGLFIWGVVILFRWALKWADRFLTNKEERDARQTAALETLADTSKAQHATQERQTEIMVRMDRDCKERHDETHKRLELIAEHVLKSDQRKQA